MDPTHNELAQTHEGIGGCRGRIGVVQVGLGLQTKPRGGVAWLGVGGARRMGQPQEQEVGSSSDGEKWAVK